jgi:hypothetical protein
MRVLVGKNRHFRATVDGSNQEKLVAIRNAQYAKMAKLKSLVIVQGY